jgi:hypothetical protein
LTMPVGIEETSMNDETIRPLIIGGQGTYMGSNFYTEFPDRELSLEYMMEAPVVAERFQYNYLVPSGGFTQIGTQNFSEAASFEKVWKEFSIRVSGYEVVKDEVALDSAENVIYGLMAARVHSLVELRQVRPIGRIGFFSQWHFKKRRMTQLAKQLGIEKAFFFHGYAHAQEAAAGDQAQGGEKTQLDQMIANDDFLLLGDDWAKKRKARYQIGRDKAGTAESDFEAHFDNRIFAEIPSRDARRVDLRKVFEKVHQCLDDVKTISLDALIGECKELDPKARKDVDARKVLEHVRQRRLKNLQDAFNETVILGDLPTDARRLLGIQP